MDFIKYEEILVLPSRRKGKLIEVEKHGKIDKKYWKVKYNIDISNEFGIAKVKFDGNEKLFSYPLEAIIIREDWIEKELGGPITIKQVIIEPGDRFGIIEKYFTFNLKNIKSIFCTIQFEEELLNYQNFKKVFKDTYQILSPLLIFSSNNPVESIAYDPRKIFKFGGYSGKKNIRVYKFLFPRYLNTDRLDYFFKNLKNFYDRLFGTLIFDNDSVRLPLNLSIDQKNDFIETDIIEDAISSLSPTSKEKYKSMVLVLNPNKKLSLHYIIKKKIIDLWSIPDQHLQYSLYESIVKNNTPKIKGFALQLYIKSLNHKEAPWILAYPSDKLSTSIYCGIGFSMNKQENEIRKSLGIIAICDAQGKAVFQEKINVSKYTNYLSKELIERILEFLRGKIQDLTIARIVLYKRGELKLNEIENLNNYMVDMKNSPFWRNINVDVITVEETDYRLFRKSGKKQIKNIKHGTILIKNDQESIICTSGHPKLGIRKGTKRLLRIRAEIINSGKTIEDITNEYYDRTFLNWMAPMTLSRFPPELVISNNIARILKEVDIKKEFPYLVV